VDMPGPATYVIKDKENEKSLERFFKTNVNTKYCNKNNLTLKKNYLTFFKKAINKRKVKLNRKKNAPSIQDPKYAYGFEESHSGELIPQLPPDRDATLGPAYYNTVVFICMIGNLLLLISNNLELNLML
jgi:hypothetical protein